MLMDSASARLFYERQAGSRYGAKHLDRSVSEDFARLTSCYVL